MSLELTRDPLEWRTERFVMRPLERTDAPELLALFGDPAVVEFMDIDPLEDLEEAYGVIDWAQSRRREGLGARWSIRPEGGGPLIGTCGFNTLELERGRRGEVAYDLARAYWGKGVMSEILPELVGIGFDGLELRRLEAFVTPGNAASCRLLERHGFAREGQLRDHGFWKGRFWDQFIYARIDQRAD
ncbi:GNAT family N-acetyltransferase [Phenylobacterium sp.]|uniref:GNAT family N-acetyltransferase n=1 Tax=Phenylobacterium sp. TaxID=1871053 RepID=UPI0035B35BF5